MDVLNHLNAIGERSSKAASWSSRREHRGRTREDRTASRRAARRRSKTSTAESGESVLGLRSGFALYSTFAPCPSCPGDLVTKSLKRLSSLLPGPSHILNTSNDHVSIVSLTPLVPYGGRFRATCDDRVPVTTGVSNMQSDFHTPASSTRKATP
jgi:tRNA(Arg) A34 adenosine deaminase TadA